MGELNLRSFKNYKVNPLGMAIGQGNVGLRVWPLFKVGKTRMGQERDGFEIVCYL